jgi:Ig-like domain CHU_C associated/Right handed beta helix region
MKFNYLKKRKLNTFLMFFFFLLFYSMGQAQTIRYVKPVASGTGNGTSWANASADLQGMINTTGVQQVWVGAGTYYSTGNGYTMKNNVAIYGGFAGTETSLAQRNWVTNVTALSGNGQQRVIYNNFTNGNVLTATAVLDGFILKNGVTSDGAGVCNYYASPTLTNVTISGNAATNVGGGGGGIYNRYYSSPNLTNVIITGNTAPTGGGGMYNANSSAPTLTNVTISGNTATYGGGMYNVSSSNPVIRNTIIYGNSTGIYNFSSTPATNSSLVQGLTDTANGNISGNVNPLFVNDPGYATAPFTGGDYSLQACSMAINTGNNSYVSAGTTKDIVGNTRIYSTTVDLGAYELQQAFMSVPAPMASAQAFADGSTVANLTATGQNLQWYSLETGGTALPSNTLLSANTYYVSQTVNGCESVRAAVNVTIIYPTPIRYVKAVATGTGNGSSWANASADFQGMINTTGAQQVWVAAGVYYSTGEGFNMKNNVAIYGGFSGTETSLSERNWVGNVTALSGVNLRRVILNNYSSAAPLTATAILDGFTITNGRATSHGGGVYNYYASPTFTNIIIKENNAASSSGGGMYNNNSSPTLTNVTIRSNTAANGGGGVYNNLSSFPILTNVTISGNTSPNGAGVYNLSSSPTLINVTISGNKATSSGGGILNYNCSPILANVTISGNTAGANSGGGMYNYGSNPLIYNSIIHGNYSGIDNFYSSTPTIYNSLVQGLTATSDGNMSGNVNPLFISAPNYATAPFTTGDYNLLPCSLAVNVGNNSYVPSGITTDITGNARIYNTTVDLGAYELQQAPVTTPVPTASAQVFCYGATVANLTATGQNLRWYTVEGGNSISSSYILNTNTYYVTQTINGCESVGMAVSVTINPAPVAPTASAQTLFIGATVADLTATGQSLQWYATATGGTALTSTTVLSTTTYYVSQIEYVNGCESARTPVSVIIPYPIRYVKPVASGTGDGTSWANASASLQGMINISAVEQVWVAAGTYYGTGNGFALKNNVAVYGGFSGTETTLSQRNWVTNVTILSGNNQRGVIYNNFTSAAPLTATAILDGVTLTNGRITTFYGAGVYNNYASPTLNNIIISRNNAAGSTGLGGGMYNSYSSPRLTNVVISGNNAVTSGGGMYNTLFSLPTLTNVTISGNKASSGGAMCNANYSNPAIRNTIIYGNSSGIINSSSNSVPVIYNSLVQGLTSTINGNISGDVNPLFVSAPDYTTAPFTGGDYRLQVNSPAINTGNNTYFAVGQIPDISSINNDLVGNPRIVDTNVDMGAYELLSECGVNTTWNGSLWSNGVPTSNVYTAIINGAYNSTGNLTACSLSVLSGNVTINSGHNLIIKGAVNINEAATLTFENNANLIQTDNVSNSGNIIYKRNSNPLHYLDYTLWSSPTSGSQTLKQFSAQTLDERFYVYNTALNAYSNYTSASGIFGANPSVVTFTPAKGYLVRMPNALPQDLATVFNGEFTGTPNNGTVNIPLATGGNRYNAVGNPYPSPINVWDLIDANEGQLDNGTLYFWRKTNNTNATTYATMTKLAYIANSAIGGELGGVFSGLPSAWVINSGQGFFVKAATGATSLHFENSMRRTLNNNQFFRMMEQNDEGNQTAISRFWLDIAGTGDTFGQTNIGYTNLTSNELDYGWDGRFLNDGEIALYSFSNTTKLAIQARSAFEQSDVVLLGYKITNPGTYTISLGQYDGVFNQDQDVILRDNLLGITRNLKTAAYTFTSEPGTFDDRFEILYVQTALGTGTPEIDDNNIIIYQKDHNVYVNTGNKIIDTIRVFDTQGRLVYDSGNINASQTSINNLRTQQQVLIVQVSTTENSTINKKIIH